MFYAFRTCPFSIFPAVLIFPVAVKLILKYQALPITSISTLYIPVSWPSVVKTANLQILRQKYFFIKKLF